MKAKWLLLLLPLLVFGCSNKAVKTNSSGLKAGVYKKANKIMLVYQADGKDVKTVAVTGDFNSWDPKGIPLEVVSGGLWKVILQLDNGLYQYKYLINGSQEVLDPKAEAYAPDGKGGKNAVVEMDYEPMDETN